MPARNATIAEVVQSVMSSDAGGRLTPRQASDAVHIALRTVIGLNCRDGSTLDIDLGNGHLLHCRLKPVSGTTNL